MKLPRITLPPPSEAVPLGLVLLVGLVLRVWGGGFGLPHVYHPDEGFEVYRALRLGMGGFDLERVSKGGYYFLLFAEFGVYFVLQLLSGAVSSVGEFARLFVQDPGPFWRIGRTTTAIMGTATVFLVWFQARRMGSGRAGLLGALFLAVSLRHVVDSHYVTVDVPMALFAFWSVVLVVEDVSGRSRLSWWGWALVAAFAVLNKLPAVILFIPYFAGAYLRGGWRGPDGVLSRRTLVPPVVAGVVFCLANPGFVLHFVHVLQAVGTTLGGVEESGEYAGVEQRTNLWAFYAATVLRSQGPAMLVLAIVGAVLGIMRGSRAVILHLAFLGPFYLLIAGAGSPHLYYERYVIPLLPGICLLAGLALDDLIRRIRFPVAQVGAVVAVVAGVAVAAEPAVSSAEWSARHARVDTRTMAADWVRANLPHRTRVLLEGFPEEDSQLAVPLPNLRRNIREMIDRLRDTDPGKARFWEMRVLTLDNPLYDLVTVRHYEPWPTLEEVRARGVEYVIVRREFFVPGLRNLAKLDAEVVGTRYRFRRQLEESPGTAALVAAFDADEDGNPGYDLEIWRLQPLPEEPPAEPEEEGTEPAPVETR